MKKDSTKSKASRLDEPREEYDFRTGIRGKHHKAYRQGHSVVIHKTDGTIATQNYKLEEGAVILDQDVRDYFPTAEAVNTALRALIALIPEKQPKRATKSRRKLEPRVSEQIS
jgi:hypothetical protein